MPTNWRGLFSLRVIGRILAGAFSEWNEDKVPRMAAAIAFYTVFSLTPIVVIAFKIAERAFGADVALREILDQAAFLIGQEGRAAVELLIHEGQPRAASPLNMAIGVGAMIFAATGVFTELKDSLNTIWEVQPKPGLGLMQMVRDRFFAFAMVLVIWFLMLVSLMASVAMTALARVATNFWGGFQAIESGVSLALVTCLFALIYKVVPDVKVAWRDVWLGALFTAALFVIGKSLFGLYLGHSTLSVSYGAAGSLVIVILWVYYSCLILLFGAEMTQVEASLHHTPLEPTEQAVHVTEHQRAQQGIPRADDVKRACEEEAKRVCEENAAKKSKELSGRTKPQHP